MKRIKLEAGIVKPTMIVNGRIIQAQIIEEVEVYEIREDEVSEEEDQCSE